MQDQKGIQSASEFLYCSGVTTAAILFLSPYLLSVSIPTFAVNWRVDRRNFPASLSQMNLSTHTAPIIRLLLLIIA